MHYMSLPELYVNDECNNIILYPLNSLAAVYLASSVDAASDLGKFRAPQVRLQDPSKRRDEPSILKTSDCA